MKSLKTKIIIAFISIVIISSLSVSIVGLSKSFSVMDNISITQYESKLLSEYNMLKSFLFEEFGDFQMTNPGILLDESGKSIENTYTYLDKFYENTGTHATIFAKNGNEFTRVLTTIKNPNGERVIGTNLDTSGKAYSEVSKGNTFIGETDILGTMYMTHYGPIYQDKNIIGIYFVGAPMSAVNDIRDSGLSETVTVVSLISIAILVAVCIISYLIVSSFVKPIKKITETAKVIAEGRFDVDLDIKLKDEIGQLSAAFKKTIVQLRNYQGYIDEISWAMESISNGDLTIELKREYTGSFKKLEENVKKLIYTFDSALIEINNTATFVSNGSDQVSSGSQALSEGAAQQASSIQELSATIEDISNEINKNAQNAKLAKEKSQLAGTEVSESNKKMQEMIAAMNEIDHKSGEINKIIKTIDDIAFQTNILALNAAVEAARAGAAGKGFAVVADEVRNLASKSSEASKNTAHLIEETIIAIQKGTEMADQTAKLMSEVVDSSENVSLIIDSIADASNEQASAINQITLGMSQISDVVQTNSATAQQSAAASEELNSQAKVLKSLVDRFKLKKTKSRE